MKALGLMTSKTNVEGRKDAKLAAKIKHFDEKGHEIVRAMVGAPGKFKWLCEKGCGFTRKHHHI